MSWRIREGKRLVQSITAFGKSCGRYPFDLNELCGGNASPDFHYDWAYFVTEAPSPKNAVFVLHSGPRHRLVAYQSDRGWILRDGGSEVFLGPVESE